MRPHPLLMTVLLAAFPAACAPKTGDAPVRPPAHAGAFYPADPSELKQFLREAMRKAPPWKGAAPRAIVAPHAGYAYSGRTAAAAYRALAAGGDQIRRVVLLAPSHYSAFRGIVLNRRPYRTPLGDFPVDLEALKALEESGVPWTQNATASTQEHADEVQVPFLQEALPHAKLVPLIVGEVPPGDLAAFAKAVASIVDGSTVLVASSDFTHYGPRFSYQPEFKQGVPAGLKELDGGAAALILKGDGKGFSDYVERTGATICGAGPIRLLLEVLKVRGIPADGKLLAYTTSGEITGDWDNSVSYAAIALGATKEGSMMQGEKHLTPDEERTLLKLARHVLARFVKDGVERYPDQDLKAFKITDGLKKPSGVFVTLQEKGQLRGCIGSILPVDPLYLGVVSNAMNAAAHDPRFQPVGPEELKDIDIEVSVMSPLIPVGSLDEIVVGRDGLILRAGGRSGVFLPQVPVEWKWDKQEYLEQLGHKAGLDKDAYKRKDAQLWRFTAQVFSEGE